MSSAETRFWVPEDAVGVLVLEAPVGASFFLSLEDDLNWLAATGIE